jgi:alpha-tubulin suppressor-like RCC1 family protein
MQQLQVSLSVIILECGELFTWGANERGQLGLGTIES